MGLTGLAGNGGFPAPAAPSQLVNGIRTFTLSPTGHLLKQTLSGKPTISNLNAGFSASGGGGDDAEFNITCTSNGGALAADTRLFTATFAAGAYGSVPSMVFAPRSNLSAAALCYLQNVAAASFELFIHVATTPANGVVLDWSFWVVGFT